MTVSYDISLNKINDATEQGIVGTFQLTWDFTTDEESVILSLDITNTDIDGSANLNEDYKFYYFNNGTQEYLDEGFNISEGGSSGTLNIYVEPINNFDSGSSANDIETINLDLSIDANWTETMDNGGFTSAALGSFSDLQLDSQLDIYNSSINVDISNYTTTIYETAADFGDAVSFDGIDDYIQLTEQSVASTFDSGSTAFTITGWLKPSTLSSNTTNHFIENVFLARASDAENDNFELGITTDGKLNLYLDTNSGDSTIELGNGELTTEEWHSFALTFDSGSVTAYIDGNEYTASINGTQLDEADGSPFTLGKSLHIDTFYHGAIDELGIWSTALTKDEIEDLRYQTLNGNEDNLVSYYTFNEDTVDEGVVADLTANANDGTLNNGDDNNFEDSKIPTFVGHVNLELTNAVEAEPGITVNYQIDSDSTATQGVDFYSSEVDVSTTDGVDPVNSVFIPQGEDSGRIYLAALPDAVAEGDEEINLNLVADFNDAVSLNGGNDYVGVASFNSFPTTEITLEGWFKRTEDSLTPLFSYATDNHDNELLIYEIDGTIRLQIDGSFINTEIAIPDEDWHHWAASWDSSDGQFLLYQDGEEVFSTNIKQGYELVGNGTFVLGQEQDSVGGGFDSDQTYTGEIDEVRVWNKVRTIDEIQDNIYKTLTGDEDNLAAYYNFDRDSVDGTTINDETKNQALSFDGSDDNVDTNADVVDLARADFTLEAWIKTTGAGEGIIVKTNGDTNWERGEKAFYTDGSGRINFVGNSNDYIKGSTAVNDGQWHHVAVVWDHSSGVNGTGKIYVDGENDTSYDGYTANKLDSEVSNNHLRIGEPNFGEVSGFFSGEMDEVRVWQTARTQAEIQENLYQSLTGNETDLEAYYDFNDGTANDLTSNNNDGTVTGAAASDNDGTLITNNEALSLDGSNDYVQIASANNGVGDFGTSQFSVELWFKTSDSDGVLIGAGKTSGDFWQLYVDNGVAKFNFDTGGNNNAAASSGNNTVNDDQWHHLVAVRDGTQSGKLYLDGVEVDTLSLTKNSSIESHTNVQIGKYVNGSDYFAGEIDELKIWDYALDADGVAANYSANSFDATDENLDAYYTFEDGTADDQSGNGNDGTLTNEATTITDNDVPVVGNSLTDSFSSDPFAAGGATYNIDGTTSATIEIEDSEDYTPGVAIVDEYGDEITADNPAIVDGNGNGDFFVKLTSQPTEAVELKIGFTIEYEVEDRVITEEQYITFDLDSTNWDTPQSISSIPTNIDFINTVEDSKTVEFSSNDPNYNFNQTVYYATASEEQKLRVEEGGTTLEETILPGVEIASSSDAFPDENLAGEVEIEFSPAVSESFTLPFTVSGTTDASISSNELDSLFSLDDALAIEDDEYVVVNGTEDDNYVTVDQNNRYTDVKITMEAWVKVDSFSKAWETVIGKDNSWWQLSRNGETNSMYFGAGDSKGIGGNTNIADGEWHHIAGVYDGWELSLYVDGKLDGQSNVLTRDLFRDDAVYGNLLIGNSGTVLDDGTTSVNDRNFAGKIDEVRVWNSARTQDQIQAGLTDSLTGSENNLDVYYSFNEDSVSDTTISDLTSNGYDGTLTNGDSDNFVATDYHQGSLDIPAGTTSATISIAGATDNSDSGDESVTVSLQSGDDYNLDLNDDEATIKIDYENPDVEFARFTTVNTLELSDEAASLLDIDVVEYAEDDSGQETSTLNIALSQQPTADVTVSLNDTANTTLTFTAENWNQSQQVTVTKEANSPNNALSLDGVNDYVSFDNTLAIDSTYTIEGWFNSSNGNTQDLIAFTETSSNTHYALLELQSSGKLRFLHRSSAGTSGGTNVYSDSTYDDGAWHHVAAVKDASGLSLYIDGVEAKTASDSSSIEDDVNLVFGRITPVNSARSFNGELNDVRIWNTARTETEIQDNLNATLDGDESGLVGYWNFDEDSNDSTNIADVTGNGNNGTLNNGDGSNIVEDTSSNITISSDLQANISSSDTTYDSQSFDLPISSSTVGISFDPSNSDSVLTTSETGDSAEFGVRLATAPNGDVVIDLTINDAAEGQFATDSPTQLTFDADNWDTYQTVSVEGVEDSDYDGNIDYNVEFDINANSTTASNYSNVSIDSVTVTNRDDETEIEIGETSETGIINNLSNVYASLSVVDSSEITEGSTAEFTVNLSEAVTEDTVVKYEIIDGSATAGDDYEALSGEVTIANGNSSATINLASIDDAIDEDSENVEIRLLAPSNSVDLKVTTAYDGNSIYLQLDSGDDIQISPGDELVFDGAVATVNSADGTPITLSSTTPTEVPVILDIESASIGTTDTTTIIIPESTFDLAVATAFDSTTGTVGLQLDSDGTEFSINPGDQIVFSHGTEDDTTVAVTVDGSNAIALTNGQEVSVPVTLNDGATVLDTNYISPVYQEDYILDEAADDYSVNLTINDNDTANVLITDDAAGTNAVTSLTTDEATGTAETFYVQLDSEPTEPVAVYFGSNDTEEGLLSDPDQTNEETVKLVFTASNWDVAQEVSVNPVDDDVDEIGNDNNYQIISTVISDDVKYNEDNVLLKVNGDFDASSDTTISLAIDELSINNTELLTGTQLSFANGMVLEVDSNTTLTNSDFTDVSVSLVTEANQIQANSTTYIDDDNDNTTAHTKLIVTEAYADNGVDDTGAEIAGGELMLELDEDSSFDSLDLIAGETLKFSNGAEFTLDAGVTVYKASAIAASQDAAETSDTPGIVPKAASGAIASNTLAVAVTKVIKDATADVNTDVADEDSGTTQIIATSNYSAGTISIQIDDASASTVEIPAGTQLNFSSGSAVILDETVTISDTAPTVINVSGVDNEITTTYGESISTDIAVTNTDDDTAGVTVTASDTSAVEGFGNNFFSVQLDSKPVGEVEVTLSPSNDDIQLDDEFDGEAATLTFDADNWSIPQNVNVTAVDDYYVEYNHSSTISTTVHSSEDDIYDQVTPPSDIEIKITDNDLPIASIEAIAGASEAGAPGYFIIELDNAAPDGADGTGIVVNYSVTGGTADADGDETSQTDDLQPLSGSVRIAPGETRSPVIAFPTDDFKVEAVPLIATAYSNNSVSLKIDTNNISPTLLETLQTEGLTIAAGTELTFSDGAIVEVDSGTSLTINSSGTSSSASVGVTFTDDSSLTDITDDATTSIPEETVIVSLSTGDDYYIDPDPNNAPSATLSIQDNDKPGVRIVEAGDRTIVNEEGSAEYYVSLLSQPEGDVTISMTGEDTVQTLEVESVDSNGKDIGLKLPTSADVTSLLLEAGNYSIGGNNVAIAADAVITDTAATVTLNDNSGISAGNTLDYTYSELGFANGSDELTFNSNNWYELQTVTLKGLDDNVVEKGDFHTSSIAYEVTSNNDFNYDGFKVSP